MGPGGGQCAQWGGGEAENCRDGRKVSPCHDPGALWSRRTILTYPLFSLKNICYI